MLTQGIQFLQMAGVFGFLGVALGAFGAHALKDKLSSEMLSVYQTGVFYHLIHTAVLLALAAYIGPYSQDCPALLSLSGLLFTTGIVLFSGSLYALALSNISIIGIITPFGGLCLLGAWGCLIIHSFKATNG